MIVFRSAVTATIALALMITGAVGCSADSEGDGTPAETEPGGNGAEEEGPVEFDPENFEDGQSGEITGISLAEFTVDELDIAETDPCELADPDSVAGMEIGRDDGDECSWSDGERREVHVSVSEDIPAATAVQHVLTMASYSGESQHEELMKSIAGYPAYQYIATPEGDSDMRMCRTEVAVADDQILQLWMVAMDGDCEEENEELTTMAVEHLLENA